MARSAARGTGVANSLAPRILAFGAIAYGLAVALSSLRPRPGTWGFDAPGYLPGPLHALTVGLVAIGAALLCAAAVRPPASAAPSSVDRAPRRGARFPLWIPLILVLAATTWLLRVRSYLLGDQQVWLDSIRADQYPHFSEPLASMAWRGYGLLLRVLAVPPLEKWLALLPVLCGIASVALAWQVSRYLAPDRNARVLALVLIGTLGTAQLYCGYVESYAVVTLAVLLYSLTGLRHAHGEGSLFLVGLALAVSVTTHLVALFLVPSYVLLVVRARAGAARRAAFVVLPLLAAAGVAWLLEIRGSDILRPFHVLRVALLTSGLGEPHPGDFAGHVATFANLIFLIMPVPALLFLSRVFAGSWRSWTPSSERAFLMAAASPGVCVAAALVLPGSPAQDWDLLSVAVLPAALLGILLGLSAPGPSSSRHRFGLAALALGPILAFVLVNADEEAGARRFKMIIDPSVRLSPHERAYANEKLAKYYMRKQDADSTLVYAERAIMAETGNPRFYANVGTALYNLRRYTEAAHYFEESIRGGLDRAEAYYQLGLCYMRLRRYEEARESFRVAADLSARSEYLHYLGLAMLATGDGPGAHAVWSYVREHWPDFEPTVRSLERHFGGAEGSVGP